MVALFFAVLDNCNIDIDLFSTYDRQASGRPN